jgi:hypothetical protein
MGLDMHLSKRTYVQNWDYMEPEERYTITVAGPSAAHIRPERITYIEEEVMYWRKANAIHKWFVQNCQNGVDECQETYISRDQVETLLTTLRTIVADPSLAKELLPPTSGFFFGSTELDDWYWDNVKRTIPVLEQLLEDRNAHNFSVHYRAGW